MKYRLFFPIQKLRDNSRLSERALSLAGNIARVCLRKFGERNSNVTLKSIYSLADFFNLEIDILVSPSAPSSEFSVLATAYKIERDGFDSWKIHLMDFVDEFRRSLDPRLIILPPPNSFDKRLTALIASTVSFLCKEIDLQTPPWTTKRYYVDSPWFPSGTESLKASALVESPMEFRNNNIYVHDNFLYRV